MDQQEVLQRYFDCWLRKDSSALPALFTEDAVYSECYGPVYMGLNQILRWFDDWNKQGAVQTWRIKRIIRQGDAMAAEWFFSYTHGQSLGCFDGVSIVLFAEDGRMRSIQEFKSQSTHIYPYGSNL